MCSSGAKECILICSLEFCNDKREYVTVAYATAGNHLASSREPRVLHLFTELL